MRIGFYGGSFDPPHCGHLAVALAAADRFALDRVLLAPTGRQPLKPEGHIASFADRFAMVRLLCKDDPRLEASTLDAPAADGEPNYTVDTLTRLHHDLSAQDTIFVIVGVDAFLDLRRWRDPNRLLELAEWIAVSRPGFSSERLDEMKLGEKQRSCVHLLDGIAEEASATAIRKSLRSGREGEVPVPGAVLAYIEQHHLYRTR